MRYVLLLFGLTAVLVMVVAGKRGDISRRPPIELFPDMDRQPKLRPQTGNETFPDGLSHNRRWRNRRAVRHGRICRKYRQDVGP